MNNGLGEQCMNSIGMISMAHASQILDSTMKTKRKGLFFKKKHINLEPKSKVIELLTDNLFDGIFLILDSQTYEIIKINDPYRVLSGGYGDSVLDTKFFHLMTSTKQKTITKLFSKVFAKRHKRPVVEITIPFGVDEKRLNHIRARVYCDENTFFVLVDRDEIAHMQEIEIIRLKALVSSAPNAGFWVTDAHGIIKDVVGKNCTNHLGYDEKEVIGMNIGTFSENPASEKHMTIKDIVKITKRTKKCGKFVNVEVVQKKVVMSNGNEYILHLDTYTPDDKDPSCIEI